MIKCNISTKKMANNFRNLVFLYGTLKRGQPNHDNWLSNAEGEAKFIGRARTVQRWPLVVASEKNVPILLSAPGRGKRVYGEVYDVDDRKLNLFDNLELHPTLYLRETLQVELLQDSSDSDSSVDENNRRQTFEENMRSLECWAYFIKEFRPELICQLPHYEDYTSGVDGKHYCSNGDENALIRYLHNNNPVTLPTLLKRLNLHAAWLSVCDKDKTK